VRDGSFDHVSFKEPIEIGELVRLFASVNFVGRTSMEIGVKVVSMNIATGRMRHTNSSYVTMVAIDKAGKPVPVRRSSSRPRTTTAEPGRRGPAAERKRLRAEHG